MVTEDSRGVIQEQDKPAVDLIQGERLKIILNELITPYLQPLGLHWRGDYYWIGDSNNHIRRVFTYELLKGGQATFSWGVNLAFLPLPSGNKLVYHRTEKNLKLHLFEWPKGYADSFRGKKINHGDGVLSNWGIDKTKDTISTVMGKEIGNIAAWYDKASDFNGIIRLAEEQVYGNNEEYNVHNIHYPPVTYVLAFLYAKTGRTEDAKNVFNAATFPEFERNPDLSVKALKNLEELGETVG